MHKRAVVCTRREAVRRTLYLCTDAEQLTTSAREPPYPLTAPKGSPAPMW
jgi:hypothetical protein